MYPANPNFGQRTPWVPHVGDNDGPLSFFETPVTVTNSVALEKGFDSGSIRLNYTNFDQNGILPNSTIKKHNFSMSGSADLNDKLHASAFANYIKTRAIGRNGTGYSNNIMGNFRHWFATIV